MRKRCTNTGVVYLRRSSARQEASLGDQMKWAQRRAAELGVELPVSLDQLERLRHERGHAEGGIYLDDAISGAELDRPGFTRLIKDVIENDQISHVFAFKRDRLGRPQDPLPLVKVEQDLLKAGVTLVFSDAVVSADSEFHGSVPIARYIEQLVTYHASGEFLTQLADRVIRAHTGLAQQGFSTGGSPPYGFARWLVDAKGNKLEKLPPGKHVRQPGCHVRWYPEDRDKIAIWLQILELASQGWGLKRIARYLNDRGIPSPGAGRLRRDQGVRHAVSGKWHPNTIASLCRNAAIMGIKTYGVRSEGTHRRLGPDGPRLLDERDYAAMGDEKPRLVTNPPSVQISASLDMEPACDEVAWQRLQQQLDQRGKSQRGIPRSRDPARYPLACRVVDMTDGCGAIMYGITNGKRRLYRCGAYQRSAGAECHSNSVDAEALLKAVLHMLREQVIRLGDRDTLKRLLEERATQAASTEDNSREAALLRADRQRLAQLDIDIRTAERRMATEQDDTRYEALARQFDELKSEQQTLKARLAQAEQKLRRRSETAANNKQAVEQALRLFEEIEQLVDDAEARAEIQQLLRVLGLRVGLEFEEGRKGKRRVRVLRGGVITLGDRELPVPLHGRLRREETKRGDLNSGSGPDRNGPPRQGRNPRHSPDQTMPKASGPGIIEESGYAASEGDNPTGAASAPGSASTADMSGRPRGAANGWRSASSSGHAGEPSPCGSHPREETTNVFPTERHPEGISLTKVNRGDWI